MSRRSRTTRRIAGIVPTLWRLAAGGSLWVLRHPQPWLASILLAGGGWALWSYAQRADAFRVADVRLPRSEEHTSELQSQR